MYTENTILLKKSKDVLKGKWGIAIASFFIYVLMSSAAGSIGKSGSILSLIIAGPLALGAAHFSLAITRGQDPNLELLFKGFNRFSTALFAYLLMIVIVALWSILLIVPGIIAALAYSLTFYLLADNPTLTATEALTKSKKLMHGYKMKLFYLCLRFFLFALLCILTLGIGFLWLIPYIHCTMALFYDDIKNSEI